MSVPGDFPHTLVNVGYPGGQAIDNWVTTDAERYKRNNDDSTAILYTPNGWVDGSAAGAPTTFRSGPNVTDPIITPPITATVLYLFNGTNLHAVLDTGYIAPEPPGGGGGTTTEGVGGETTIDDAEGNLVNYPSFTEMNVSVSALSPFGSDYIYYLLKDFVVLDSRVISDESERNYTFDYGTEQSSQYGEWQLYVAHVPSSATKVLHILNIPVPTIVSRRGSLNFW